MLAFTGRYPLDVKSPYIFQCQHDANVRMGQGDYVHLNSSFVAKELHNAGYADP